MYYLLKFASLVVVSAKRTGLSQRVAVPQFSVFNCRL